MEAIDNVNSFMKDRNLDSLMNDRILYFAIVKNIEIIGEAAYKLSKEFKKQHPEIPWNQIEKMRHVLVHGYYTISVPLLYNVYTEDIPVLENYIKGLKKIQSE